MDNGLVPKIRQNMPELSCCLNPCCSGRWARTQRASGGANLALSSLNPCCSGQWSSTSTVGRYAIDYDGS